ncbi:carboxypeptidase-like regulatory domain-containing protein [Xanthovirga aplysinae]|uniref:carboxypeptidase-like regulatory domain-containing protein n=1 Tax=Xanthovirga aplysinae TaxID=2529853 RepID=UPI0012BCE0EB
MKRFAIILAFFLFFVSKNHTFAQRKGQGQPLIHVTGAVIDGESLELLPYTTITLKSPLRGTFTSETGFFSFYGQPSDTVYFSSVGYQDKSFIVPKNIKEKNYSVIIRMFKDTVFLEAVTIYPLPEIDEFKRSILELQLPPDEAEQLQKQTSELVQYRYSQDKFYYEQRQYFYNFNNIRIFYATNFTGYMAPNNWIDPDQWIKFFKNYNDTKRKEKITKQVFYPRYGGN